MVKPPGNPSRARAGDSLLAALGKSTRSCAKSRHQTGPGVGQGLAGGSRDALAAISAATYDGGWRAGAGAVTGL